MKRKTPCPSFSSSWRFYENSSQISSNTTTGEQCASRFSKKKGLRGGCSSDHGWEHCKAFRSALYKNAKAEDACVVDEFRTAAEVRNSFEYPVTVTWFKLGYRHEQGNPSRLHNAFFFTPMIWLLRFSRVFFYRIGIAHNERDSPNIWKQGTYSKKRKEMKKPKKNTNNKRKLTVLWSNNRLCAGSAFSAACAQRLCTRAHYCS